MTRVRRGVAGAVVLGATALAAAGIAGSATAASTAPVAGGATAGAKELRGVPRGTISLSNERTETRWAYAASLAPIRAQPSTKSRSISRLRLRTELGNAESYLVLSSFKDRNGIEWLRIRVPGRPNGRLGWVSSNALGALRRTTTSVEVQRWRNRVLVRRNGRVVFRAPIGHGRPGRPTPAGRYWIRDRFRVPAGTIYGVRALGTAAYAPKLTDWPLGGVIGFHGTNQPGLVPGRPSNGCIRMRNRDVVRFYRLVRVGTPVWIH